MNSHQIVPLREHPNNMDKEACLVSGFHEPGAIFRVSGGFMVVLEGQKAIITLFPTEAAARRAQNTYCGGQS